MIHPQLAYQKSLQNLKFFLDTKAPQSIIHLACLRVRYWRQKCESEQLIKVCAWCQPETSGPNITHVICEACKEELLNIWRSKQ